MKNRNRIRLILLAVCCLLLSGCRTRTTGGGQADLNRQPDTAAGIRTETAGMIPDKDPEDRGDADGPDAGAESGARTTENPEASRKEYDETRPAELVPGTERTLHEPGEGSGASAAAEDSEETVAAVSETAENTATRTVKADQAEQTGISEDAEEASSAMTYYTVLLQERTGSLFECQRQTVYWETAEDHVTVFRTSPEHTMILNAGAYDVSARLLEENLHVDDGWIGRKNPGVIVKAVDGKVLGTGVVSPGTARKVYAELLARDGWASVDAVRNGRVLLISVELLEAPHLQTAAELIIACTANPDLFTDVDVDQALEMLAEEATGSGMSGIFHYAGQSGI